jgi:hypothetical protein
MEAQFLYKNEDIVSSSVQTNPATDCVIRDAVYATLSSSFSKLI